MKRFPVTLVVVLAALSLCVAARGEILYVPSTGTMSGPGNLAGGFFNSSDGDVIATWSGEGPDRFVHVDRDGVYLDGPGDLVHVTFNQDVTLIGYGVNFALNGVIGDIEFYVDNGPIHSEPGLSYGAYSLATPLPVPVGSVLTINGNPDRAAELASLIVTVPEPASVGLLASAGAACARRTRRAA